VKRELELIYVGDAMCSWCWGFAPAIDAVQSRTGLAVQLVNGGLRPGDAAEPLSPAMGDFLLGCWTQVHKASGQPFDHEGLRKPPGWRYDTLLPACAVVTMRRLLPAKALDFYHRLQRAFYAEAIDITDPATWPALLHGFDVDADAFVVEATGSESRREAWADFAQTQRWGISGFPTLLASNGSELAIVTRGWTPTEPLVDTVERWLAEQRLGRLDGASCALDGTGC
jgi:putative protein-disulfide isomerase